MEWEVQYRYCWRYTRCHYHKQKCGSGESFELYFEGLIADTRLGVNIPVKTDSIMLTTVDKSEDTYGLSIGDSQIIQYNPFL